MPQKSHLPLESKDLPFQKGESLLGQNHEVPQTPPVVSLRDDGYVDTPSQKELYSYHPEVVLFCPQIPQNTGTIARLCGAFSCTLHLIEPMGFSITEKGLRRAGLDYWDHVNVYVHKNFESFAACRKDRRFIFIETGGSQSPHGFPFAPGDVIIFGAETFGIPKDIRSAYHDTGHAHLTIPMFNRGVRSLNLANTVSLVLFAAVAHLHPEFGSSP